jgi:hypothetical protein
MIMVLNYIRGHFGFIPPEILHELTSFLGEQDKRFEYMNQESSKNIKKEVAKLL